MALPTGSSPVDFAYAIHTEVGHRTIGARVNGRLVPLESTLDNGDVVEVFTSKAPNAGPEPRLARRSCKSPRARNKIRQWFTKERREEAIEQGKDQIARLMRKEGLPLKRVLTHETLSTVAAELRLADVSALYAAVGEGNLGAQAVVRRVIDLHGGDEGAAEDLAEGVTITTEPLDEAADRRRRRGDRQGPLRRLGQAREVLHPGAGRRDHRLRHPRRRRLGAPRRLHQRRQPDARSPSGSSRSSGRRRRSRCSWWTSRSRRSTAPGCSRTSPGCCPTCTSTSCPRRCRPPATGSPRAGSPSRWPTRSTSATS